MVNYIKRDFYPTGNVRFEYLRKNGLVDYLKCWDENGRLIELKYLHYVAQDSDEDLVEKIKYICKRMPWPVLVNRNIESEAMISEKTHYKGIDY
jgi:antitoxin component YwqK of YwqJK toxin-antitoxin module